VIVLSGIFFVVLMIFLVPVYWVLSRYATKRTLRQWRDNSDDLIRKTLSSRSDYDTLAVAQMSDDSKIDHRWKELAREEAVRRGLDFNKPIDPSVRGYPIPIERPIRVQSHNRRRPRPRM
jgi:hypothetical protein